MHIDVYFIYWCIIAHTLPKHRRPWHETSKNTYIPTIANSYGHMTLENLPSYLCIFHINTKNFPSFRTFFQNQRETVNNTVVCEKYPRRCEKYLTLKSAVRVRIIHLKKRVLTKLKRNSEQMSYPNYSESKSNLQQYYYYYSSSVRIVSVFLDFARDCNILQSL